MTSSADIIIEEEPAGSHDPARRRIWTVRAVGVITIAGLVALGWPLAARSPASIEPLELGAGGDSAFAPPGPQAPAAPPAVAAAVEESAPTDEPVPAAPPEESSVDPIIVPDPRPGDLRVDANADVLPTAYTPEPPRAPQLDVPYGPDPEQQLDVYLPARDHAPAVVYLHAGGWVAGGKEHLPDMVLRFAELGYAVVSVGYRLAPDHPFPAPVEDVKRALRWVKVMGEETGAIDGDRIVLYGASAGGHLAAFVAATPGDFEPTGLTPAEERVDSTVAGVVSVVGPTDLVSFADHPHDWALTLTRAHLGCELCTDETLAHASPLWRLGDDVPPAYWAVGAQDPLVDPDTQGAPVAAAWAAAGGPLSSWYDVVDDAGHNIDESIINQRFVELFVEFATQAG
ncbi:MAG: alpha/beta hydrolase [Acidimicrobiales bacterium]|nr:alpha/beta hydrolase [Acidimicrobiales bacterium]